MKKLLHTLLPRLLSPIREICKSSSSNNELLKYWNPESVQILEYLTDRQLYWELWTTMLSSSFLDSDFEFNTSAHLNTRNIGNLLVCEKLSRILVLIVTWVPPNGDFETANDPHLGQTTVDNWSAGETGRIFRIHCVGTSIASYRLRRKYSKRSRQYESSFPASSGVARWNTNLLEPNGFRCLSELILSLEKICSVPVNSITADLVPHLHSHFNHLNSTLNHGRLQPNTNRPQVSQRHIHLLSGQSKRTIHATSTSIVNLPVEIVSSIIDMLGLEDVQSLCLVNTWLAPICQRRLWRTYHIRNMNMAASGELIESWGEPVEAIECLRALRGRFPTSSGAPVQRLVIGPLCWRWDDVSLELIHGLWGAVPQLHELCLRMPSVTHPQSTRACNVLHDIGSEFSPVLRSLGSADAARLRLRIFRFRGALFPDSPLYNFLSSQTGLVELDGVDVAHDRFDRLPSEFLPNLQTLTCTRSKTASLFLPSRQILSLSINRKLPTSYLSKLHDSLESYPSLTHLSIGVKGSPKFETTDWEKISSTYPNLQSIEVTGMFPPIHSLQTFFQSAPNVRHLSGWLLDGRYPSLEEAANGLSQVLDFLPRTVHSLQDLSYFVTCRR